MIFLAGPDGAGAGGFFRPGAAYLPPSKCGQEYSTP